MGKLKKAIAKEGLYKAYVERGAFWDTVKAFFIIIILTILILILFY